MRFLYTFSWLLFAIVLVTGRRVDFQKIIDEVNSGDSTWTAGHNFDTTTTFENLQHMTGLIDDLDQSMRKGVKVVNHTNINIGIPDEFDARKHWKNCKTIKSISAQGACSSSWAQCIADTFADRLCVGTKAKVNSPRSSEELLSCCSGCAAKNACSGGYLVNTWKYIQNYGLVTGGGYNSKTGCQPYTFKPCKHTKPNENMPNCNGMPVPTPPACQESCTNKSYKKKFDSDKQYIDECYYLYTEEDVQKDIIMYGPALSGMTVYEDFYTYKKGVYSHVSGSSTGKHAVRIIGWGKEKGVDYWLVANNWNKHWGDKGTFKIKRGNNECDIEVYLMGAKIRK